jgi:hypothetical protein
MPKLAGPTAHLKEPSSEPLSVAIILSEKDKSGTPLVNRADRFKVVVTNRSRKPIRLWRQ